MAIDFYTNLKGQLAEKPDAELQRHLNRVDRIRSPDRKARVLARMEGHVRLHLGLNLTDAIDWSTIDWPSVLKIIIQLLIAILPLILSIL